MNRVAVIALLTVGIACGGHAAGEKPANAPSTPAAGPPPDFDRGNAAEVMVTTRRGIQPCKGTDGPSGAATVEVTVAPSGEPVDVKIVDYQGQPNPFPGTRTAECIVEKFRAARFKPFTDAKPVRVKTMIQIH